MDYRSIIEEEARKYGIRVYYHSRSAQWGRSDLGGKRVFLPSPHRFPSFFTGLHEIAHIMSKHHGWDGKPEYIWEYDAFSWALNFCMEKGIIVPQRTVNYERSVIAEKVRESAESGLRNIDKIVVKFVHDGRDDDADVIFVKKNIRRNGRVYLANR